MILVLLHETIPGLYDGLTVSRDSLVKVAYFSGSLFVFPAKNVAGPIKLQNLKYSILNGQMMF